MIRKRASRKPINTKVVFDCVDSVAWTAPNQVKSRYIPNSWRKYAQANKLFDRPFLSGIIKRADELKRIINSLILPDIFTLINNVMDRMAKAGVKPDVPSRAYIETLADSYIDDVASRMRLGPEEKNQLYNLYMNYVNATHPYVEAYHRYKSIVEDQASNLARQRELLNQQIAQAQAKGEDTTQYTQQLAELERQENALRNQAAQLHTSFKEAANQANHFARAMDAFYVNKGIPTYYEKSLNRYSENLPSIEQFGGPKSPQPAPVATPAPRPQPMSPQGGPQPSMAPTPQAGSPPAPKTIPGLESGWFVPHEMVAEGPAPAQPSQPPAPMPPQSEPSGTASKTESAPWRIELDTTTFSPSSQPLFRPQLFRQPKPPTPMAPAEWFVPPETEETWYGKGTPTQPASQASSQPSPAPQPAPQTSPRLQAGWFVPTDLAETLNQGSTPAPAPQPSAPPQASQPLTPSPTSQAKAAIVQELTGLQDQQIYQTAISKGLGDADAQKAVNLANEIKQTVIEMQRIRDDVINKYMNDVNTVRNMKARAVEGERVDVGLYGHAELARLHYAHRIQPYYNKHVMLSSKLVEQARQLDSLLGLKGKESFEYKALSLSPNPFKDDPSLLGFYSNEAALKELYYERRLKELQELQQPGPTTTPQPTQPASEAGEPPEPTPPTPETSLVPAEGGTPAPVASPVPSEPTKPWFSAEDFANGAKAYAYQAARLLGYNHGEALNFAESAYNKALSASSRVLPSGHAKKFPESYGWFDTNVFGTEIEQITNQLDSFAGKDPETVKKLRALAAETALRVGETLNAIPFNRFAKMMDEVTPEWWNEFEKTISDNVQGRAFSLGLPLESARHVARIIAHSITETVKNDWLNFRYGVASSRLSGAPHFHPTPHAITETPPVHDSLQPGPTPTPQPPQGGPAPTPQPGPAPTPQPPAPPQAGPTATPQVGPIPTPQPPQAGPAPTPQPTQPAAPAAGRGSRSSQGLTSLVSSIGKTLYNIAKPFIPQIPRNSPHVTQPVFGNIAGLDYEDTRQFALDGNLYNIRNFHLIRSPNGTFNIAPLLLAVDQLIPNFDPDLKPQVAALIRNLVARGDYGDAFAIQNDEGKIYWIQLDRGRGGNLIIKLITLFDAETDEDYIRALAEESQNIRRRYANPARYPFGYTQPPVVPPWAFAGYGYGYPYPYAPIQPYPLPYPR